VARRRTSNNRNSNGANIGYEAELWKMADALRGSMDAAIWKNLKELGYGGQPL